MQKPTKADELEVEPDLHLDCDVLILEYTVHNALKVLFDLPETTGHKHHDEGLVDISLQLRMVESFLKVFQASHPDYSLSTTTKFLLHLLQFASLLLLRHDHTAISPSQTSLSTLRQANQTRASEWRKAVGKDAFPAKLLGAYSPSARNTLKPDTTNSSPPRDISPSKAQALWSPRSSRLLLRVARAEKSEKTWSEIAATSFPNRSTDAVKRHYSTLMSRTDQAEEEAEDELENMDMEVQEPEEAGGQAKTGTLRSTQHDDQGVSSSPAKKHARWSPRSNRLLVEVAGKRGSKDWDDIARRHFPNRTGVSLKKQVLIAKRSLEALRDQQEAADVASETDHGTDEDAEHSTLSTSEHRARWTSDDNRLLMETVRNKGGRSLPDIAAQHFPNRSENAVEAQYYALSRQANVETIRAARRDVAMDMDGDEVHEADKGGLMKAVDTSTSGHWSSTSNSLLMEIVANKGRRTWAELAAQHFPNRSEHAVLMQYSKLRRMGNTATEAVSSDVAMDLDVDTDEGQKEDDEEAAEKAFSADTATAQESSETRDTVTLLDLLPSFIDLTAKRMTMGGNIDGSTSNTSASSPSPVSDDASSESTAGHFAWATEPQWLRLAAAFMLQGVLETQLDLGLSSTPSAACILEAFAWGWTRFSGSKDHDMNNTSSTSKENRIRIDRSVTIPDSDEGDITVLTSTPIPTPPSHPTLFNLKHEENTISAGASWRALRHQALNLLIPSAEDDVHSHLTKLRQHHPYSTWQKQLLGFLQHLFTSVEQPLLVQLEKVYPAWAAAHPDDVAMSQGTQMTMTQQMNESPVKNKIMQAQSQRQTQTQSQTQNTPTKRQRWADTAIGRMVDDDDEMDEDVCDIGWLAASGGSVRMGGMILLEAEVDVLIKLVSEWWI